MKKMLFLLLAVMSAATMFAEQPTETPYLWRDGCKIYAGDQLLSQQAYKNLLKNTCPEAFAQYRKGEVMANWGWGVLGVGALSMVASCIPLYLPNPYSKTEPTPVPGPTGVGEYTPDIENAGTEDEWAKHHGFNDATLAAGLSMIFVGTAVVASSIPIICVGYAKRDKSLGIYNLQCKQKEPAVTYSLTAGQNGIGFVVNF